jgi:hypothetical protein
VRSLTSTGSTQSKHLFKPSLEHLPEPWPGYRPKLQRKVQSVMSNIVEIRVPVPALNKVNYSTLILMRPDQLQVGAGTGTNDKNVSGILPVHGLESRLPMPITEPRLAPNMGHPATMTKILTPIT